MQLMQPNYVDELQLLERRILRLNRMPDTLKQGRDKSEPSSILKQPDVPVVQRQ